MKITFKRIKIENFKNLEHLETEFGNKTYIYGANETGKTTFADAISYVLTGKNSFGESQFEFIPVGSVGLSPKVVLELELQDKKKFAYLGGKKFVTLVRIYQAKKNKNGNFTGEYQTVCHIDGLKVGPKEYEKWIEEHICNSEIFRLIHDVRYFTENISTNGKERTWEAQRRLLFSICCMKSDIDMAKYKKRFSDIVEGLQQYDDVNQYLEKLKSDEKNINFTIESANDIIREINEDFDADKNEPNVPKRKYCKYCGSVISTQMISRQVNDMNLVTKLHNSVTDKLEERAQIRRKIDICKDLIELKCKLAQKKVNEMLDGVQVEFFKKNKTNGEMKDCLNLYWNGVPYQSLSYSTKFIVSMKIALAFQKFYGISMPVIIDNAESIDCIDIPIQSIVLYKRNVEGCPNCNCINSTGRKENDGLWTCFICGHRFKKTLEIKTEE